MKKIYYILFLFTVLSNAQIKLHNVEANTDINDGDVITITENNVATHIVVTNNYSYDINIKLEVLDITNTDGSEMSICFGVGGNGGVILPFNRCGISRRRPLGPRSINRIQGYCFLPRTD